MSSNKSYSTFTEVGLSVFGAHVVVYSQNTKTVSNRKQSQSSQFHFSQIQVLIEIRMLSSEPI